MWVGRHLIPQHQQEGTPTPWHEEEGTPTPQDRLPTQVSSNNRAFQASPLALRVRVAQIPAWNGAAYEWAGTQTPSLRFGGLPQSHGPDILRFGGTRWGADQSATHTTEWGSPAELTPALRSRVVFSNGAHRGHSLDPRSRIADPPLRHWCRGAMLTSGRSPRPGVRPAAQAVLGPASLCLSTSLDAPCSALPGPRVRAWGRQARLRGADGLPSGSGWP